MKRRCIKVNAISFAKLVAAMLDGTMTKRELAEVTGLHYLTVCQYTRELHLQGAAHIVMWEKDARGRDAMPVFQIGAGKDKPRHKETPASRAKKYREKKGAIEMIQRMVGEVAA